MNSSLYLLQGTLLAASSFSGPAPSAHASIIDANRAPSSHSCRALEREAFLRCSATTKTEPAPKGNSIEFFTDGCGDSITVQLSSGIQDPITYPGKITYIGDDRTDYSFAPQSPEGEFLNTVSTFVEGPDGVARASLRGSGVDSLPLICRYQ